jgi:hypothetical protein
MGTELLAGLLPDATVNHLTYHFDDKSIIAFRWWEIMRPGRTTRRG